MSKLNKLFEERNVHQYIKQEFHCWAKDNLGIGVMMVPAENGVLADDNDDENCLL